MKNIEKTTILEYINYTQLMANSLNEDDFNKYALSDNVPNILKVYSYLISGIHSINDAKLFNDNYSRAIFDFLDIEVVEFDTLISFLFKIYKQDDIEKPITLTEFKNALQCVHFIVSTDIVDISKFSTFREIMIAVRQIKKMNLIKEEKDIEINF